MPHLAMITNAGFTWLIYEIILLIKPILFTFDKQKG